MRTYALLNNVPIIKDEGLEYLIEVIRKYNVKNILEIGTAIGYSASVMSKCNDAYVTTIERDPKMYEEALKNIKYLGLDTKISIIFSDALEAFELVKNQKFDMIFIDAAKGQYKKFFQIYNRLLKPTGIIVCDNMDFHGLTDADPKTLTRGVRGLVTKLNAFRGFLYDNPLFDTHYTPIGDGMTVSTRIKPDIINLEEKYLSTIGTKIMHKDYDEYYDSLTSHVCIKCHLDLTKELLIEKTSEAKQKGFNSIKFICNNECTDIEIQKNAYISLDMNDVICYAYTGEIQWIISGDVALISGNFLVDDKVNDSKSLEKTINELIYKGVKYIVLDSKYEEIYTKLNHINIYMYNSYHLDLKE